jgi:para-nitrobenzyl esterase
MDNPAADLTDQNQAGTTRTTGEGIFYNKDGEPIGLSVASLALGSAVGKSEVTPQDTAIGASGSADQRVVNIAVLMQTLDQDGDLNNGIQISPAIASMVFSAGVINFDQAPAAFAADPKVTSLLSDLNSASPPVFTDTDPRPRTLRSATAAMELYARSTSERKVVTTQYGLLNGFAANDTTWQWLGVPYAKPPLGDLRWRAPQHLESWRGLRDAIAWSDTAAQNPFFEKLLGEGDMSEDCLYLNITAPKDAKRLPVMVWFHGGGFVMGSGNAKNFNNAESLPTKGVVLVTVNHRLGPFGYLAHPLLTAESGYGGSGNYGQMDQIAALQWVKQNIKAFGGDPNSVTIFGESGGGGKVTSLMNSPLAKGLFHKVICESGQAVSTMAILNAPTLAAAEAVGVSLFKKLGVTTLAQARAKTWTEIMDADLSTTNNGDNKDSYGPNIDSYYAPKNMEDSIKAGLPNDVPLLAGANSGDMPGLVPGLIEQMPWRSTYNKANQYVYKFSKVPSGWQSKGILAWHGDEMMYVFNYPGDIVLTYQMGMPIDPATGKQLVIGDLNGNGVLASAGDMADVMASAGWDAADDAVADTTMTIWTNFAKTGNPSTADFTWPAYTTANDTYVEISTKLDVKKGLSKGF